MKAFLLGFRGYLIACPIVFDRLRDCPCSPVGMTLTACLSASFRPIPGCISHRNPVQTRFIVGLFIVKNMPNKIDCVAIVSGGMDSVILLHFLVHEGKTPAVITFEYGQKHAKEVECARYNAALFSLEHRIVSLTNLAYLFSSSALVSQNLAIPNIEEVQGNPQPPTYVPNRNMIFLALAAAYAESVSVSTVYYGAQAHDLYGYWDTHPTSSAA